jgi:ABC-type nickel/cobalt efflux system permease component RcnA|tara:strand:- start:20 stop:325 length:306 start_codon:yes stop_codon:yes gene_type:complete|eukprot:31108-Pelagococcus_subviridis.AAC.6
MAEAILERFTAFVTENVKFSQEDFAILGLNCVGCVLFYYFMRLLRVPDHSWYLTLYSSGVTSFFGLYMLYHVCLDGFTAVLVREDDITRCETAPHTTPFAW